MAADEDLWSDEHERDAMKFVRSNRISATAAILVALAFVVAAVLLVLVVRQVLNDEFCLSGNCEAAVLGTA